jgi:hypothetical protein
LGAVLIKFPAIDNKPKIKIIFAINPAERPFFLDWELYCPDLKNNLI